MVSCSGSLVQSSCGEGGALQADITGVCGEDPQCPATLGLPRSRVCAFPVYTAQAPGCSIGSRPCVACGFSFQVPHKSADSVGPAFCAFPAQAAQAARSLTGALSPVRCTLPSAVHLLPSAVPASVSARALVGCALCLFLGAGL